MKTLSQKIYFSENLVFNLFSFEPINCILCFNLRIQIKLGNLFRFSVVGRKEKINEKLTKTVCNNYDTLAIKGFTHSSSYLSFILSEIK